MKRIARLAQQLQNARTEGDRFQCLCEYLRSAPAEDVAWTAYFICGKPQVRAVKYEEIKDWAREASDCPIWLFEQCYELTKDIAETAALVVPLKVETEKPFTDWMRRSTALQKVSTESRKALVQSAWQELDVDQRRIWNAILLGRFRLSATATMVAEALALHLNVPREQLIVRLLRDWSPSARFFDDLRAEQREGKADWTPLRFAPYRAVDESAAHNTTNGAWHVCALRGGIRAQLAKWNGRVHIWSETGNLTEEYFGLALAGATLPEQTVLEGELIPLHDEPAARKKPSVQRKKNRPQERLLFHDLDAEFYAYDLLQYNGEMLREESIAERRTLLDKVLAGCSQVHAILLKDSHEFTDWDQVVQLRSQCRTMGTTGLLIASCGEIAVPRDWQFWMAPRLSLHAVLMYANWINGEEEYTFGVWEGNGLIPIAKLAVELPDEEAAELQNYVTSSTLQKHGPVRVVQPAHVFELEFDRISVTPKRRSGYLLEGAEVKRWAKEIPVREGAKITDLRALVG